MGTSVARLSRSSPLPFGALTDAALVAYALWTIAANAVVAAGGGARSLLAAFAVAALATFALIGSVATRPALRDAYLADLADESLAPRAPLNRAGLAGLLGLPLLSVGAWLVTRNPWVAWAGSVVCVLYAVVHALRMQSAPIGADLADAARTPPSDYEHIALHVLALACAVFSLLVVRPRADDTFYLNMAISVADYPQQALLSLKNLHGPASDTLGVQRMFAPYRVHSFELLGGLFSYVSGIDAVRIIHLGFATALCWLTPFAVARLMRLLLPRAWLLGVVAVLVFYMIEGSAARGYANHALVRMFNGKSAMLTLAVPLICAAGLRFGARPSRMRLLVLAAGQITAVGLSSTGLWLAPTVAMVSVAAGTLRVRELPARLVGSLLSSAYVLALGLWVFSQVSASVGNPGEVEARSEPVVASASATLPADVAVPDVPPRFVELAEAVPVVFGPERTALALLGVVWLAGLLGPSVLGLRLFSFLFAVVALGFANPFLARLISRIVTGVTTYQRIFWLLPVAVGVGVCCGAIYVAVRARFAPPFAVALASIALAAFLALATDRLVISDANQAKLQFPPALKLWSHSRDEALEVCRWAPAGAYVLASQAVSLQLPMMHGCGHPLATFDRWLSASEPEKLQRNALVQLVDDRQDIATDKIAWFVAALAHYHVDAVVLSRSAVRNMRVKALIRLADYERVATVDWDQIFVRTRAETRLESTAVAREACRNAPKGRGILAPFGVSAAIERLDCAEAIEAPTRVLKASPADFDDLLALERAVYMDTDPSEQEQAALAASMDRRGVGSVVLANPARGNKWLKAMLARLGFRKMRGQSDYSILVRSAGPTP